MSDAPRSHAESFAGDPIAAWIDACLDLPRAERDRALERLLDEHPAERRQLSARLQMLRDAGLLDEAGTSSSMPERLGPYRLLEPLGAGGMGVVYAAVEEPLGRPVALKIIRPELKFFEGSRKRFDREIEAVARLQHENIVPLYAAGEHEGVAFLAMQRVHGASLADLLPRLPRIAVDRIDRASVEAALAALTRGTERVDLSRLGETWLAMCLEIARQVAEALEHAHGRLVIHRDVKPSNIMLTSRGTAMLLDFGLARAGGATRITRSGSTMGSLAYMSPEQHRGENDAVGPTSDVYSLGAALYELLCRKPPFDQEEPGALRAAILAGDPPAPRSRAPELARDVDAVLLTALACRRERRYASAGALVRDLTNLLEGRPVSARKPSRMQLLARWCRRHPTITTAAFLTVVVGPIVLAVQALRAQSVLQQEMHRTQAHAGIIRGNMSSMLRETYRDIAALPGASALRQKILDRTDLTLQELQRQATESAPLDLELASLHGLRGDALSASRDGNSDQRDAALAHYLAALEHWRRFLLQEPERFSALLDLHTIELRIAEHYRSIEERAKSLEYAERSLQGFEALLLRKPEHKDLRRELVHVLCERAEHGDADRDERRLYFERAEACCRQLLSEDSEDEMAGVWLVHCMARGAAGLPAAAAVDRFERARAEIERLVAKADWHATYHDLHIRVLLDLGGAYEAAGRGDTAAVAFEEAAELVLRALQRDGEIRTEVELYCEVLTQAAHYARRCLPFSCQRIAELLNQALRCSSLRVPVPPSHRRIHETILDIWDTVLEDLSNRSSTQVAEAMKHLLNGWESVHRPRGSAEGPDYREQLASRCVEVCAHRLELEVERLAALPDPTQPSDAAKQRSARVEQALTCAWYLYGFAGRNSDRMPAVAVQALDRILPVCETLQRLEPDSFNARVSSWHFLYLRGITRHGAASRRDLTASLRAEEAVFAAHRRSATTAQASSRGLGAEGDLRTQPTLREMRWHSLTALLRRCRPWHLPAFLVACAEEHSHLLSLERLRRDRPGVDLDLEYACAVLSSATASASTRAAALALARDVLATESGSGENEDRLSAMAQAAYALGRLEPAADLRRRALSLFEAKGRGDSFPYLLAEHQRELDRYHRALDLQRSAAPK